MSDEDLTTAYMVGYHKRDDEVAALKAEIERLRGLLRECSDCMDDYWCGDELMKRVREALGDER